MRGTVRGAIRRSLAGIRPSPPSGRLDDRRERPDVRGRTSGTAPSGPTATDGGTRREAEDDAHLRAIPDGAGCTEIWEHLSDGHGGGAAPDE